jgi:transcriptional regulator with GAF, ATPase, and Fis domain
MTTYQMQDIIELAHILSRQNDLNEIIRLIGEKTTVLLHAEMTLLLLLNPRTQQTVKTLYRGGEAIPPRFHNMQNQISGWILSQNKSFHSTDLLHDPRFNFIRYKEDAITAAIGVPLCVEGFPIGTIILLNKADQPAFSTSDLELLEAIAVIVAPYLRNVKELQHHFETPLPANSLLAKYQKLGLLGKSKSFLALLQSIEAAARCDVRVLLEGQTGTGKELVARAIHRCSSRSEAPFVAVDCGAIPEHLLESELFGHSKGAFTGAHSDRKGLFEEADRGVLYLDEIANLPFDMQAKLLRVLQEGVIRPVGSNKSVQVDVRIISAASMSLRQQMDDKRFREDLFYRLYVYPIHMPSLHDRREDIPQLADHFLRMYAEQQNKKISGLSKDLLDILLLHNWQGNIRELENVMLRLVTLAPLNVELLSLALLPKEQREQFKQMKNSVADRLEKKTMQEKLAAYEKELILAALHENGWHQSATARMLKISVQALRYKMNKLNIHEE